MSNKTKGFASLSQEKRKSIASLGGKASHAKGVAHRFTSEEASAAGKKSKRNYARTI